MLKQDFKRLLKFRLGNRQDTDFDEIIELEATEAQATQIEQNGLFFPFFLESDFSTVSTGVGSEFVILPSDFLAESEDHSWSILVEGTYVPLDKVRYDEMDAQFAEEARGTPRYFSLGLDTISLRPVPDKVYTIRFKYFASDTPFNSLPDTGENRILRYASDWLMAATGRVVAGEHLHDDVLMQKFDAQLAEAKARIMTLHEAREHTNRTYRMEPK